MQPTRPAIIQRPLAAHRKLLRSKGYRCTIIRTSAQTTCIYHFDPADPLKTVPSHEPRRP